MPRFLMQERPEFGGFRRQAYAGGKTRLM